MTEHEVFQHTLEAAIRRRLGAPGEVKDLVRLTGGATKLTWSFDAVVGDTTVPLILQQTPPDRLAAASELGGSRVHGAQDAALLTAAASDIVAALPRAVVARAAGLGLAVQSFDLPVAVPAITVIQTWHPRFDKDAGHRWLRQLVKATIVDTAAP